MSLISKTMRIALLGTIIVAGSLTHVAAQEISQSKLAAAQLVVKSAPSLGNFDNLLPVLSTTTKDQLIRVRPDLYKEISGVVDEVALKLAVRRADLDNDIARVWAKNFTEEELIAIDAFFSSDVGKKYKEVGVATIGREILQASRSWRNRVGDELLEKSKEELKKQGYEF